MINQKRKKYHPGDRIGEIEIIRPLEGSLYEVKCLKCGEIITITVGELYNNQLDLYGCRKCQNLPHDELKTRFDIRIKTLREKYKGQVISGALINDVVIREYVSSKGQKYRRAAFDIICQKCGKKSIIGEHHLLKGCSSCARKESRKNKNN